MNRKPVGYAVYLLGALCALILFSMAYTIVSFRDEVVTQTGEFRENTVFFASQFERDHLHLLLELSRYMQSPRAAADTDRLLERYDILWSRIDVLSQGTLGEEINSVEGAAETLLQSKQIIHGAETDFDALEAVPVDRLRELVQRLNTLSPRIHDLKLKATYRQHAAAEQRRKRLVQSYTNTLYWAAGAVVSGLLVAVIFFVQNRSLRRLQRNLEGHVAERTVELTRANDELAQEIDVRCKAELRLREQQHLAEQASAAKSRFLANMSHELRTPLNAIIGYADIMKTEMFGPLQNQRYRGYVDDIHSAGSHLSNLLKDILDLAKIESGKLVINPQPVDLAVLAAECLDMLESLQRQKGHQVDKAGIFPVRARVDAVAVKQILLNMLSNAFKYTPDGGRIAVRFSIGDWLEVTVQDNGIGIPEDDLEEVLEPFHQVGQGAENSSGGTGIGLSIANQLAGLHGGALKISSRLDEGSRVTLRLPLDCMQTANTENDTGASARLH